MKTIPDDGKQQRQPKPAEEKAADRRQSEHDKASLCVKCVHGRKGGYRECRLGFPQVNVHWFYNYFRGLSPRPRGEGCGGFSEEHAPVDETESRLHVLIIDPSADVVTAVLTPREARDAYHNDGWVVGRAPVPPVGAAIEFEHPERRDSFFATVRWRELDLLGRPGRTRKVEARWLHLYDLWRR